MQMVNPYEALTITVAIASGIIIPIYLATKPQSITFKIIRHDSVVHEPIESKVALEVSHPGQTN